MLTGASVNAQDKTGATALFAAVTSGHLNVVQTLKNMGADINKPTTRGSSPLLGRTVIELVCL